MPAPHCWDLICRAQASSCSHGPARGCRGPLEADPAAPRPPGPWPGSPSPLTPGYCRDGAVPVTSLKSAPCWFHRSPSVLSHFPFPASVSYADSILTALLPGVTFETREGTLCCRQGSAMQPHALRGAEEEDAEALRARGTPESLFPTQLEKPRNPPACVLSEQH